MLADFLIDDSPRIHDTVQVNVAFAASVTSFERHKGTHDNLLISPRR